MSTDISSATSMADDRKEKLEKRKKKNPDVL